MRLFYQGVILLLFFPAFLPAQTVSMVRAERAGRDSVRIFYTLEDPAAERTYRVDIFAITRTDTFLLTKVYGDIGDSLKVGEHSAVWNAIGESGRFRGPVSFRIRAIPSFLIHDPKVGLTLKRGNPFTFSWYGGNSYLDDLSLVLYQYDNALDTIKIVSQSDQFTWQVPADMTPGKGYRVRIIGTGKTGINSFTNEFTIARKIPLYYIIAPAATLLGGTAAFLILRRKELPPPIDPTE
ncbi:MAG: Ser-Thr-rich GPI-anchored membrane family protein [Bacteroidia bacterium]|nr:Ser-Thr-rich GPI-anchored membrane family protein [Bacteroidia bacterium]